MTDPFTRHPAITASAMATLDELSYGRAVLGIGAGVSGFREMGLERRRPALAVAEAVQLVRELLRGAHTSFHGQVVRFDGRLDFMPQRPGAADLCGRRRAEDARRRWPAWRRRDNRVVYD